MLANNILIDTGSPIVSIFKIELEAFLLRFIYVFQKYIYESIRFNEVDWHMLFIVNAMETN